MQHPSYLSIASPDVMAAWYQLEHEAAAEPRLPRRPAAGTRPIATRLLLPLLALLAAATAAMLAPPLLAARQLQQVLATADPPALAALADWDQLRANLARRMLPATAAQPYLSDMAEQVAEGLANAEALHAALRAPADAARPLPRPGAGGVWRLTLESAAHGRAEVTLARAGGMAGRWLVVDLALPAGPEANDE